MKIILALLALIPSLLLAQPYPMGWRSNPHHMRGLTQIASVPDFGKEKAPPAESVADLFYWTNQEERGACVGFTGGECMDAIYKKKYGQHFYPSFLDFYQQLLVHDGNFPNDYGSYTSSALWVGKNVGVLTAKSWPYSKPLNKLPPRSILGERSKYRVIEAFDVPHDDKGYAIKQCIGVLKIPVLTGGYWYNNGFTAKLVSCKTKDGSGRTITVRRHTIPLPSGRPVGGHEVSLIEYDDNMWVDLDRDGYRDLREIGWVRFKNHWLEGQNDPWGDDIGSAWAAYAYMLNPRYFEDNGAFKFVK